MKDLRQGREEFEEFDANGMAMICNDVTSKWQAGRVRVMTGTDDTTYEY